MTRTRIHMTLAATAVAFASALSPGTWAQTTVIHEGTRTESIAPYMAPLLGDGWRPQDEAPAGRPGGPAGDMDIFPIRTPQMRPGHLGASQPAAEVAARLRGLSRPFCLIGSDELSLRWLAGNRSDLLEMGAICMLVEAETVNDLSTVLQHARGIPMTPASASDLAEHLGLSVYPVLITRDGFRQ